MNQEKNTAKLLPLPADDDLLIRRSDLSLYTPIAPQTYAKWACNNSGPPYVKMGRIVAYRVGDLKAWLASRTQQQSQADSG